MGENMFKKLLLIFVGVIIGLMMCIKAELSNIRKELQDIRIDTQDVRLSAASMNLRDKYGLSNKK